MPATLSAPAPTNAPSTAPKTASPPSGPPPQKSSNAPIAPPTVSPSTEEEGAFGDTFAELDAIDKGSTAKDAIGKTSQKAQERTPAAPAPDAKKDTKDSSTESQTDAGSAPPATEQSVKPERIEKAAELRAVWDGLLGRLKAKNYNEAKQRLNEYESKVAAYETKLKEYESKPPEDNKPLLEKLATYEKKIAEYEEDRRFNNYVKSEEFQKDYQQPYNEAWDEAINQITQLTVNLEDGSTRQATPDDIVALANTPLSMLDERAEAMFGRSHARVVLQVENIRSLAKKQEKAIANAKKLAAEREANLKVQREQSDNYVAKILQETNDRLRTKYPKWFGEDPNDPEGNTIFKKSTDYVDQAFRGKDIHPDERTKRIAIIRNKAANHDRLALHLKNANAQIAELQASLKAYEESEPAAGKANEATPAKGTGNWEDEANAEIEALNKR